MRETGSVSLRNSVITGFLFGAADYDEAARAKRDDGASRPEFISWMSLCERLTPPFKFKYRVY
jgi:hypothetical protein